MELLPMRSAVFSCLAFSALAAPFATESEIQSINNALDSIVSKANANLPRFVSEKALDPLVVVTSGHYETSKAFDLKLCNATANVSPTHFIHVIVIGRLFNGEYDWLEKVANCLHPSC